MFCDVLRNQQPDLQQGAFLAALVAKGETTDELFAAWRAIDEIDTVHVEPKVPRALWVPYTKDLSDGVFEPVRLCGNARPHRWHGRSLSELKNHPDKAYEWDNYRFASGPLNASKRTLDDTVLDPYEVGVAGFEIEIAIPANACDKRYRPANGAKAEFTLKKLEIA